MFFAALTSASKIDPQLVQTKRDRLMRLAASTVPQAWQHCDVCAGSTTMIRIRTTAPCTPAWVRIIRGDTRAASGSGLPVSLSQRTERFDRASASLRHGFDLQILNDDDVVVLGDHRGALCAASLFGLQNLATLRVGETLPVRCSRSRQINHRDFGEHDRLDAAEIDADLDAAVAFGTPTGRSTCDEGLAVHMGRSPSARGIRS
jgi:hypothetical protein